MKKIERSGLTTILALQPRNALRGFFTLISVLALAGGVSNCVNNIKYDRELNEKLYGTRKLTKEDKKEMAPDVALIVVALAVISLMSMLFIGTNEENKDAAIRVARRYILQMRKKNPELKQYDHILRNNAAMLSIAKGVLNKLPSNELFALSIEREIISSYYGDVKYGSLADLKLKNEAIQRIVDYLKRYATYHKDFTDEAMRLIAENAKTFSLENYMVNQKVRG